MWAILTRGESTSCGCFRREKTSESFSTHGLSKHPLFLVYTEMKRRCFYEKHKSYHNYGGRGILMYEEWVSCFKTFYDWACSNGYEQGLSIDRIDNDKGYFPENCRWVEIDIQSRNKRTTRNYTAFGETKCLFDWGADSRCVVGVWALRARVDRDAYEGNFEKCLTTPEDRKKASSNSKAAIRITAWGETKCMSDWYKDKRCEVGLDALRERIGKGWSGEEAMTKPARTERAVIIEAFGEIKSMADWLRDDRCIVKVDALRLRISKGWNKEDAITTPSKTGQKINKNG